jgi:HEAT repeat protein
MITGLVLGAIPTQATIQRLERRWALVVAIDAYPDDGIPKRKDTVASAWRLSELLTQRYGYEPERVIRLMNAEATTAGLFSTINELRKRIGREDSLLVYVSLHSARMQTRTALVPFDGRAGQAWTWVSLEAVVEALSGLASGAVLAVFDGCVADDPSGLSRREALALRTLPSGSIEMLAGCPLNPLRGPTGIGAVLADELDRAADEGRGLTASDLMEALSRSLGAPDNVGYSRPSFVLRPSFAFVPSETDPLRAVRTGDAVTKKRAITALGERLRSQPTGEKATAIVRELLAVASNAGEDVEVRATAVAALGAGQGPFLASELSKLLVDAKAPEPLRLQIVDTLEQLKDPESIRALDRAAARGSPGVRVASLRALARLGARSSLPVFAGVLKGPAPADVQAAALEAIQLLGPGSHDPTVVQSVLAVVERSRTDADLRRSAVTTLGSLADPSSERALLSLLKGDPDAGVRAAAASALGRLSSHADSNLAVMALERALTEPSGFVREAAAVALGRLKALRAEGALIQTLNDREASVRSAAAEALGKLSAPGARPALVHSLEDISPDVRRAAGGSQWAVRRHDTNGAARHIGRRSGPRCQRSREPLARGLPGSGARPDQAAQRRFAGLGAVGRSAESG